MSTDTARPALTAEAPEPTLISVYTRTEMLLDGSLIDVTPAGAAAGLRLPVALSRLAYRTLVQMSYEDPLPRRRRGQEMRLHAVLLAFAQTALKASDRDLSGPSLAFSALDLHGEHASLYAVVEQHCAGPALTVLMQGED